jgi:hypothetical protein
LFRFFVLVTVYKLVSLETVDEDIFKMQEKKVKMNAAIMESSNAATESQEKKELLRAVVHRFMKSPEGTRVQSSIDKENHDAEEDII